jgi:hypothetical protein
MDRRGHTLRPFSVSVYSSMQDLGRLCGLVKLGAHKDTETPFQLMSKPLIVRRRMTRSSQVTLGSSLCPLRRRHVNRIAPLLGAASQISRVRRGCREEICTGGHTHLENQPTYQQSLFSLAQSQGPGMTKQYEDGSSETTCLSDARKTGDQSSMHV